MKKVTAILLSILMLVSVFVSCVGDDNTTTTDIPTTEAPTTEAPTTEAPTTEAPSTKDPNVIWSSKNDVRDTWNGKTLNVACSTWYDTGTPWAMPESFITKGNDAKFGAQIQRQFSTVTSLLKTRTVLRLIG